MIYAIALCLYVLCYLVIQVMFLFYGCHVSQHKRKVFVILVVYTILFKGMDFLLNSPDPSALSTTTYWTYWAVHTLDTFIIIALMAVYADGTLGRNWVKLFFYYDLVTTGANMLIQNKLVLFLTDHHLVESASLFSASHPKDLLWILAWAYTAAAIALSIVLFRKPLNRLISKIPENLCLLLMGITFPIYIGRVFVMFIYRGAVFPIRQPIFPRHLVQRRRYTGHPPFDHAVSADHCCPAEIPVAKDPASRERYAAEILPERLGAPREHPQSASRSFQPSVRTGKQLPRLSADHLRSDRPSDPQPAFLAIHKDRRPVLPRKIRNLPLSAKHFAEEKASAGGSLHHRNRGHPSLYDPLTETAVPTGPETSGHVQADESNRQNPRRLRFLDERHKSLYLHVIPAFLKEESLAANHHC